MCFHYLLVCSRYLLVKTGKSKVTDNIKDHSWFLPSLWNAISTKVLFTCWPGAPNYVVYKFFKKCYFKNLYNSSSVILVTIFKTKTSSICKTQGISIYICNVYMYSIKMFKYCLPNYVHWVSLLGLPVNSSWSLRRQLASQA